MEVVKDWRGGMPTSSREWWICIFTYGVYWVWRVAATHYEFTNDAIVYTHGIINTRHDRLYYYRMRNVSSEDALFSGGKVIVEYGNGHVQVLPCIKNAEEVVDELQKRVDTARRKNHVRETNIQY